MAEANFNSVADGILREIFQAYSFIEEWDELKKLIVQGITKFHKEQAYNTLSEQVFFQVIGKHVRDILQLEDKFEPTSLREPFIIDLDREFMQKSIHHSLVTEVTTIILSSRSDRSGAASLNKLQTLVEHLLNYYREKWTGNIFFFAEVIGSTLLRTVHKSEFQIVHDILSPDNAPNINRVRPSRPHSVLLESGADCNTNVERLVDNDTLLNSYYSSQDTITQVYSLGLTSKDDYLKIFRRIAGVSDEIADMLDMYSLVGMENVCGRIVGSLLCNSMRVAIWAFRFLHRPAERAVEPNHFIGQLSRLGNVKDVGALTKNTPVSSTVKHYIQSCLERGFPVWLKENSGYISASVELSDSCSGRAPPSNVTGGGTVLARRAEHLVNAIYVLTGIISERGVMIAILLLRVFHEDSPVSEKMLRMYNKIVEEYLPSDHPNAKYSLIYTNNLIWNIIKREDEALFLHLKEHMPKDRNGGEDVQVSTPDGWNLSFGGIFKKIKKEMPLGMALVKGWLDTGFLGWLPEFGVIFIWDQLALLGGTSTQNQRFVVRLCVQLLKLMRDALLGATNSFASVLRKCGKTLRSKEVFNVVCETLILYTDDIPLEERLENESTKDREAALSIQKICRGYISRLRAKLIRRARQEDSTDSYLNTNGDFHSYEWMRKLSLQTDKSRAYQLQEIEKFNRTMGGRNTLRMGNSRSECMIDVYGPPDQTEYENNHADFLMPVISPPLHPQHDQVPVVSADTILSNLDDTAGREEKLGTDNEKVGDPPIQIEEEAPQSVEAVPPKLGDPLNEWPSLDQQSSASDVTRVEGVEPSAVLSIEGSALMPIPVDDCGNDMVEPTDATNTENETVEASGAVTQNSQSIEEQAEGQSAASKEIDPTDDIFARSLLGMPSISQKTDIEQVPADDPAPALSTDNDAIINIIRDKEDVGLVLPEPKLEVVPGYNEALDPYDQTNFMLDPALKSSASPIASLLVFPPLEPALKQEIFSLSLSTVTLNSGLTIDDEIEQYAQLQENPPDYVSLGSLPRSCVSPARKDGKDSIVESPAVDHNAVKNEADLPTVNPAPSLYGFFLEDREAIREDYYRLEAISKEIQLRKHAFEQAEKRFITPSEKASIFGELEREFAELKLGIDNKAVNLRQKEMILLSKWSNPMP